MCPSPQPAAQTAIPTAWHRSKRVPHRSPMCSAASETHGGVQVPWQVLGGMLRARTAALAAMSLLAASAHGQGDNFGEAACRARGMQLWESFTGPQGIFDDDCRVDDINSLCFHYAEVHAGCVENAKYCEKITDNSDTTCESGQYCCTGFTSKVDFGEFGGIKTTPSGLCKIASRTPRRPLRRRRRRR